MPPPPLRQFGPYRLDPTSGQLWHHDQVLDLPPRALAVLGQLVAHAGQLVTKEALLAAGWPDTAVSEWVLTTCMRALRRALGDDARQPQYIATVHRHGYRFVAAVTVPALPAVAPAEHALLVTPALPLPPSAALSPLLVGRTAELDTLRQALAQALRGQRQVVLVSGEAGLGKTTVVDAFLATLASEVPLWVAWGQCLPHYGAGEAYLPVLDALGRLGRAPEHARLLGLLRQYAPTWVVQLPALFPVADLEGAQHQVVGATRERMLREAADVLEAVSAEQPLVLVLEDLHWSDHATLDLLTWLARRREPARLLVLGTYRPVEVIVQGHPLQAVTQELVLHGQCVELRLEGLSAAAVTAYLTARFPGSAVAARLAGVLHQRTEGQPLFMKQTVDAWVQQGWVAEVAGQWEVQVAVDTMAQGVAASVRQLIAQQCDGLPPSAQAVLEAGSVVGAEFSAAAVAAGLDLAVEQVEAQCEALVRRGQLVQGGKEVWPDGTVAGRYAFVHTLYQQVVYERLPVGQQMQLHRRIGVRQEVGYGGQASAHAAELALHFERGRDVPRALRYAQQAAENALRRCAYQEATRHLHRGLALLQTLPDTLERAQQELTVQLTLGQVLMVTLGQGTAAVEQAYARAQALCQQLGAPPQLAGVLSGLRMVYLARGELQQAHDLGDHLLRLGQRTADPAILLDAHYALGVTCFLQGEVVQARTHLEQSLTLCTAQPACFQSSVGGIDWGMVALLGYTAWSLWVLGYPAQALQQSQAALTLAQESTHAYGLVSALSLAASVHWFRRETPLAHECTAAALSLARQQEFPLDAAWNTILQGWALVEQGHGEAGLVQMHQGLAAWRATQVEAQRPYLLALLAAAYGRVGQATAGLGALTEAVTLVAHTGERWWEAELYRLQGELSLQSAVQSPESRGSTPHAAHCMPHAEEAEAHFQQALAVARRQQAKSLELRAAVSLARLWQQQDKQDDARALLTEVYSWFTEGFDTADLQEARILLEALGG
jgi:DNA-binding winged helix-turn-helix (wHTH) protein/predicted ATPase